MSKCLFLGRFFSVYIHRHVYIPSMKEIAKAEGGSVEEIAGMPAVRTSRDAYVIQLSRDTFAVITPAD
ncbi:MAG: hypothetical protein U9P12_03500, partial [Verrucomicrobiota bacterium]|nr:hypothetical protein [Verrucomicrobiota bacterium]